MANYFELSNFLKKNTKKISNKLIEKEGQAYFSSVCCDLSLIGQDCGLLNITKKQGGGVAEGTRKGRLVKEYIWYKFAFDEYKDFPINIGVFIFKDHFNVSLQLDYKKLNDKKINYKNFFSLFYSMNKSEKLIYCLNGDLNRQIDLSKCNNVSDFIEKDHDTEDIVIPIYNIQKEKSNKKLSEKISEGVD